MFVFVFVQNFNYNLQLSLLFSNWLIIVYVCGLSLPVKTLASENDFERKVTRNLSGDSTNNSSNIKLTFKNISIILNSRKENRDSIK